MALPKYRFLFGIFLSCLIIMLGAMQATGKDINRFIYVSLRNDNAIAIYKVDTTNGTLAKVFTEPVSGGPASLTTDASKRYLYVAQRSSNRISAYRIQPETGRLTLINSIAAVDNPVYLSTDSENRFLFSAYYGASKAAVYPIAPDGSLSNTPVQVSNTGLNPHAMIADPTNQFVYITNMTGNAIQQFIFDVQKGTFNPLNPAEIVPKAGTGPRHLIFHGTKPLLYVVNELGNSVTVYQYDKQLGTLLVLQNISTLPVGFSGSSKCADIHLTPDKRFLYASNRGHESITGFQVDPESGMLAMIGTFPTVNSPREFDIDPNGKYLYAAGETSNNLAWYRINQENGKLDSLGTITVGKNPSWVLAIDMKANPSSAKIDLFTTPSNDLELTCWPNPFFDTVSINVFIKKASMIKVIITNQTGREIKVLHEGECPSGKRTFHWQTGNKHLLNGTYFCTIETETGRRTIKLIKSNIE